MSKRCHQARCGPSAILQWPTQQTPTNDVSMIEMRACGMQGVRPSSAATLADADRRAPRQAVASPAQPSPLQQKWPGPAQIPGEPDYVDQRSSGASQQVPSQQAGGRLPSSSQPGGTGLPAASQQRMGRLPHIPGEPTYVGQKTPGATCRPKPVASQAGQQGPKSVLGSKGSRACSNFELAGTRGV